MDKTLVNFSKLLEQNSIDYWIDGGTLLGLKRDGKLLKSDPDIDYGIWHKDLDKLEKLIDDISEKINVSKIAFGTWVYKVKLIYLGENSREVDINVFKQDKFGNAICPQRCSVRYTKPHLKNSIINKYWRGFLFKIAKNKLFLNVTDFPWSTVYDVWTWKVPASYFENLEKDEEYHIYRPKDWEGYMILKFGDWKTPCSNWDFLVDDKTIVREAPEI